MLFAVQVLLDTQVLLDGAGDALSRGERYHEVGFGNRVGFVPFRLESFA
jgi:hypothetical protein